MSSVLTKVRQQPAWIAAAIFILLTLWILSGVAASPDSAEEKSKKVEQEVPLAKVKVERLQADRVNREITLYGRTEPDRQATLRAEIRGQVKQVLVDRGQVVKAGDVLFRLDQNDLKQQLLSTKALLKQREIELEGAESLGKKGYQSQSTQAQAEANLQAAKANVEKLQLSIENTQIIAPFDGVLNDRYVEVGDYLREGDEIAMVVDLQPLVIRADVTENHVRELELGQAAHGRLVSGELMHGKIRYISSVSNQGTNTFKIEVAVDNSKNQYIAGMSTELSVPMQQTWAIKITPAVMALDEQGNLGVKVVKQKQVHFVPIDIVRSDNQGVWLSGLGQSADVITLGHGFVRDGDMVDVVQDNAPMAKN